MNSNSLPLTRRAGIGLAWIAGFVLLVLFVLGLPVVLVWPKWVFAAVLALALVLALPVWLIRRRWARDRDDYSPGRSYLAFALVVLALLVVLLAAPVYYIANRVDARPATMPQAILSNGKKTVVFQGMVHIGSEPFYQGVVWEVEKALADGYTMFYEGVEPSPESKEATEWFTNTLAGGGDLSANYKMLGDLCGLKFQLDYFGPVEAHKKDHPAQHVIADVTHLDMYKEFQRLAKADPAFAQRAAEQTAKSAKGAAGDDPFTWIASSMKGSTEGQKYVVGTLCRGLVSRTFARVGPQGEALEPVILDYRNRELARRIAEYPGEKIFVTYGAAHLPGTVAELRKIDPAWGIKSIKWTRAISAPDRLDGELMPVPPVGP